LDWQGSTADSIFINRTILTINNNNNNNVARITYIPEWISVEDDDSNPVSENYPVMNAQRLWIYPVCKNGAEKRCDAIEITDATGVKLQISVEQCGCNDIQVYLYIHLWRIHLLT